MKAYLYLAAALLRKKKTTPKRRNKTMRQLRLLTLLLLLISLFGCNDDEDYLVLPKSPSSACDQYSDKKTVFTESVTLPANCVVENAEFIIRGSGITVDGNNIVVRNEDHVVTALWVQAMEGSWRPFRSGFTRFQVVGGQYGFRPHLILNPAKAEYFNKNPEEMLDYLYSVGPVGAFATHSTFVAQVREGAYIWVGAQATKFTHNKIYKAGSTCMYVTSATRTATIANNHFESCGYWTATGFPRLNKRSRRECLALDGTNGNQVLNNTFNACADEGITVYQNNGEHGAISWNGKVNPEPDVLHVPRLQTSRGNLIEANIVKNSGFGVAYAIGSRFDVPYTDAIYATREPYLVEGSLYFFHSGAEDTTFTNNDCRGDIAELKGDNPIVNGNLCTLSKGSVTRTRAGIPTQFLD